MAKKILTIDDQADIRRLVRMTLEFEGYEVTEASSGEDGLALLKQYEPDLILLDVMMPGMDGVAVSQYLKSDLKLRDIPVVMLTALDRESDMKAGIHAGANMYLTKPFSPIELLDKVAVLLKEKTEK